MERLNKFKLYEYEISFNIDKKITKQKLKKFLVFLSNYLLKEKSILKDIQISLKKPKSYRTFRLKKQLTNTNNPLYTELEKKYICTLHLSTTPHILDEIIYNLKIQKISSNIMAIKHLKNV
jgi:hypothetical protein|uniref:Uncharacterized protein n=1 Tax=Thecamonas trahens TaxID=529818 RepID=A0A0B5H2R9_THETB|nr:hypothetical protein [Thecamonas trahens]AJF36643.1 hypothetical protein [Thecamonas trahens]